VVSCFAQDPCYPGELITASYATGGSSGYKSNVIWLTWGAQSNSDQYGRTDQALSNGASSFASLPLSDRKYLCMEATLENITGTTIRSYIPGNWSGDTMDDQYNIGGTGTNNQMVAGIATTNGTATFTVRCKAFLEGHPIKLGGLVIADAESLNNSGESIHAVADGEWVITSVVKNIGAGSYLVQKSNVASGQQIDFLSGNDDNTGAISFLSFNETAFESEVNDYEVTFDVEFTGGGTTAIALGLVIPNIDTGDAPESYGAPIHTLEALNFTTDNVPLNIPTDLNTSTYEPANVERGSSDFIGTVVPDPDNGQAHSTDALGDDNLGFADEEDAWPEHLKEFSYTATYMPGDVITATIPYVGDTDSHIYGWIDFNLNGVFEIEERAYAPAPASQSSVDLQWTVPIQRVPRSTYVRLRYSADQTAVQDPSLTSQGGEVEDHKIRILGPAVTNPVFHSRSKQNIDY